LFFFVFKEKTQQNTPILPSNKFEYHDDNDDVSLIVLPPKEASNDKVSQQRQISPEEEINIEKEKRLKTMIPMTPQEYEEKQRKAKELNELEIEDATVWEPPKGQTGKY